MTSDTIFAPITGRGGAVTVVRLSGPAALEIARSLAGRLPPARRAGLRELVDGAGACLDRALVTVFPAPHSFSGEDCVEISLHGGRAVLTAVSDRLVGLGARPAEPGEFSRRAFLNGRFDLLEAEATADLIAAETEAQRRQAIDGAGGLRDACTAWRESLRLIMARQEALIDFPDEDLPPEADEALRGGARELLAQMRAALAGAPLAARVREGLEFVILGAPNAGKSTLLNALAGADVAIVSELPGTTRDAIGVRIDLGGMLVNVTDTAGLRETDDPVEGQGVARARARGAAADLVIAVAPAPAPRFPETPEGVEVFRVVTKADLTDSVMQGVMSVSAKTGAGMPAFVEALAQVAARLTDARGSPALGRPRQVACVRDAAAALERALLTEEPELRGEELRAAAAALGRLVGSIGVEEILDAVFGSFCIGK